MTFEQLRLRAVEAVGPRRLSDSAEAGGVGAAILARSGAVYVGVCVDTCCGMGFCAEQAAAAAMISAGEQDISMVVAVDDCGRVMPPCGKCREFLSQIGDNGEARVMVDESTVVGLSELLPRDWRSQRRA